jgi:three-Cys-motif partner protein
MVQDHNNYFFEQRDWSKRKLEIIRSYLSGFTKILGSTTSQACVYYVDGFAGKGIYDDQSKGSPYLAAELAQSYLDQNKKYHLNCINVEASEENFTNLQKSTSKFNTLVVNLKGTFSTNIPQILKLLGKCPAFFFIDPFGVKGTDWIDMVKIIRRDYPTDLWLRFDHRTVRRLSGFFESGSSGAASKTQNLKNLYGIQQTDSLLIRLDGKSSDERIQNAVDYYIERTENEFCQCKNFGYSAAFPIVSLEGDNKYYLVFAASHPKAVILASETVYSVERNRAQEIRDYLEKKTGQLFLFSTDPSENELATLIAEKLIDDIWHLCYGKKLSRQEINITLLKNDKKKWFGHFSSAHLNLALSIMENENNPRIIQRSGPRSQDKTIFTFK